MNDLIYIEALLRMRRLYQRRKTALVASRHSTVEDIHSIAMEIRALDMRLMSMIPPGVEVQLRTLTNHP